MTRGRLVELGNDVTPSHHTTHMCVCVREEDGRLYSRHCRKSFPPDALDSSTIFFSRDKTSGGGGGGVGLFHTIFGFFPFLCVRPIPETTHKEEDDITIKIFFLFNSQLVSPPLPPTYQEIIKEGKKLKFFIFLIYNETRRL